MINKIKIDYLKSLKYVNFYEPLSVTAIKSCFINQKCQLPDDYVSILTQTDGFDLFGGYFRFFGLNESKPFNLRSWNDNALWKFAWEGKLDKFLCIGETAWGDQYAFSLDNSGIIASQQIYFIESITMNPEIIADNFEDFFSQEILQNATKPYDSLVIEVRNKIGDLTLNEHIIYMPSLLMGGEENSDNVQKIEAVSSMIINADLCSQLSSELRNKPIKEIQTYVDEKGRSRLKVVWYPTD